MNNIKRLIQRIFNRIFGIYLCIRFPFLKFNNNIFDDCNWYYSIPIGWRKSFGIEMCKEIKKILKRHNALKTYKIMDIKEKYASLEIYDYGAPSELNDILAKYEYISERTCIKCGRRAKYITKGWMVPYCEDCIDEYQKYNADEYYKDIDWYGYKKYN